jgi:S-DNA-T family DNA segregation ATPase FtsK/SpoIIIE
LLGSSGCRWLAHGFGVRSCRIRTARPGLVILELVRRDALAAVIPALPIPAVPDLQALPVGRREDGEMFTIRLHGTHLLIAGATGAGKGSYLWGLVRAMLGAMASGLVRVHACDPKLMELAFDRAMFEKFGKYVADPADIAEMLEADVRDMQDRAARFAGRQRDHQPTTEHPFVVVLVDEVAFLTAYQADRKLEDRILGGLSDPDDPGPGGRPLRRGGLAGPAQRSPEHPQPVPGQDRASAR